MNGGPGTSTVSSIAWVYEFTATDTDDDTDDNNA
jgi:hypothetical protein|eukprot:COSAG06_NODE_5703_length_3313_cov_2.301805_1_plen_34_part_00